MFLGCEGQISDEGLNKQLAACSKFESANCPECCIELGYDRPLK